MKFGKLAARRDSRTLPLARYLPPDLPPPPPAFDALDRVKANLKTRNIPSLFPMDGNDRYGCCCAEGTKVAAPGVQAVYRAPYSGPVVTIRTERGRVLTVTPNHAVLTPRGFVPARLLKQGQNLIGSRWAEGLWPGRLHADLNQSPTAVEEVFAAQNGIGAVVRRIVNSATHFHGDGEFINGDIDVVYPDGFLKSEPDASLGQPDGEEQIGTTRELEGAFASAGASFQSDGPRGLAALCGVRRFRHGEALTRSEPRVPQRKLLPLGARCYAGLDETPLEVAPANAELGAERINPLSGLITDERSREVDFSIPQIVFSLPTPASDNEGISVSSDRCEASIAHPTLESGPTDPELPGQLFCRFSGDVTADRIIDVRHHDYRGHVYDLSTEQRWYLSNGIISHNCVVAGAAHCETLWEAWCSKRRVPSRKSVIDTYFRLTGGEDSGLVMLDTLRVWRKKGLLGERVLAFVSVNPKHTETVKQAISIFGCLYVGFECGPDTIAQFEHGEPWTPAESYDGGHCVVLTGYDADTVTALTWGRKARGTWSWLEADCDEMFCVLPGEATLAAFAPGFDYATLQADLQKVTA